MLFNNKVEVYINRTVFCSGLIGVYGSFEDPGIFTCIFAPHLYFYALQRAYCLKYPLTCIFTPPADRIVLRCSCLHKSVLLLLLIVVITRGLNNKIKCLCASITIGIKCAQTLIFYLL